MSTFLLVPALLQELFFRLSKISGPSGFNLNQGTRGSNGQFPEQTDDALEVLHFLRKLEFYFRFVVFWRHHVRFLIYQSDC